MSEEENAILKFVEVAVAGFITETQTMLTKTGRPWSKTMLEDAGGTYELCLFGKDHENFMQYLVLHSSIYVEGEIGEKYFAKQEGSAPRKDVPYVFKPKKVVLLGNVADTYIKGFSINVTTPMLSPQFREGLVKLIKKHKGNVPLTMNLYDPVKKWNIEFMSRKFKVNINADFIYDIEQMGITYKVIK